MGTLLRDVRFAVRHYLKTPGATALAVVSLALGIGVNSAIFSLVSAVVLRDLPAERPEELVDVYFGKASEYKYATASHPDYLDLRRDSRAFSELAAVNVTVGATERDGATELLFGEAVSGNYLALLDREPALGRGFLPEEDGVPGAHPVAMLGHRAWRQRFGADPNVLGRTLRLNGVDFQIVGVAPRDLAGSFPGLVADYFIPMAMSDRMSEMASLADRGSRSLFIKGRLAPGVTLEQARAEMETLNARLAAAWPDTNEGIEVTLVPTREVVLNPGIDGPILGVAGLLMGIVGLVLVIACSNVASVLLSRAAERRREIAVRLAIGAGRGRLVRQLLTESLLLAGAGGALGLGLAAGLARLLVSFKPPLPIPLSIDVGVDGTVLAFTAAVALLTGLLCGLAPALQSSRPQLVPALKDDAGGLGRRHRRLGLRNLLVVGQVAASTVLLVGAGLFVRSLGQARSIDPGFALDRGVAVQLALGLGGAYDEAEGRVFLRRLVERARALPGARSAALAENLPLGLSIHTGRVELEGQQLASWDQGPEVDQSSVGTGYFETLGIPIVRGRAFTSADGQQAPRVAVINEAAARHFWPAGDALGKRLREDQDGPWIEVVGIARDGKYRTLGEAPRPFLYLASEQDYRPFATLVVATDGDERAMLAAVRRLVSELDPALPVFDMKTMSDHLQVMLFPARMGALLLTALGGLGLLLATVGLYGVVASSVVRRTREVGIRMAIGARPADVVRLVVGEGMALAGAGLALGIAAALAAARVLEGLLYGIGTTDAATFVVVVAVLAAVGLVANLVPARRASRLDPVAALRRE